MNIYDLFLVLSLFAGFLMAFNLGANDVANSMASAVGARAITVRQAVFVAGILNFVGALFLGSHVTSTISKGIIDPSLIADPKVIMVGMLASLLSAGLWVLIATVTSLPVSSTHSVVGSIMGFGIAAGGLGVVNWWIVGAIVASWVISPFFAATLGFTVFSHIRRYILYKKHFIVQAVRWAPFWMGLAVFLVALSFVYKTPLGKTIGLEWWGKLVLAAGLGVMMWAVGRYFVKRLVLVEDEGAETVERIFRRMQVGTSCYVALSHGANDVANAIGPVAAVYMIARNQTFMAEAEVPLFMLALGGVGIAVGIMVLGYKVMKTVGERITVLTNTRGFSVDFGAASTVLLASKLGLPVSSTHAAVGAVVGVGLARGFKAVDFRVLLRIVTYWILTLPIAAVTSIVLFVVLKAIFL
jgi:PiT family inorganic phosphate transporter